MEEYIFDIETDGFLDSVTKIHCLSFCKADDPDSMTTYTDPQSMIDFFRQDYLFIGHYIIGYDLKVINRLLGIDPPKNVVDTLGLSWYLYPERDSHGLEGYGDELGVPKPPIKDWKSLTIEEYIFRCESDVHINQRLWTKLIKPRLQEIYS